MNRPLLREDFPLAVAGNLILSPIRREPVLVAADCALASQIAWSLNIAAAQEVGFELRLEPWLVVH